jgi:hypothetical protein
VPGYAANTAQNVAAGPTVAPVSLATDLAIATIFAVVGVTVYLLLRRIDRRAAGRRVVFAAVAAGMILVNLAFHHAALLFAAGPGSTAVGAQNSDGLVVLLLGMHDHGYTITGAFFGLWLLALGHLAYQSSLFPPGAEHPAHRQLDSRLAGRVRMARPADSRPHHPRPSRCGRSVAGRLPGHQGRARSDA